MNRIGLLAVAAIALLAGGGAQAGYSWSYSTTNCSVPANGTSCTTTGLAAGTPTLTTTAYSNTNGSSATPDSYKLETAYLSVYSGGLGVTNRDAGTGAGQDLNEGVDPEHSIDSNQRYDSVLLNFGSAVKLTSMTIGWSNTDSDMTVLAYTGTGSPIANLANLTYSQLTANGWKLVGSYGNVAVNTLQGINAANVVSQYWLIGAFNPLVDTSSTLTKGDDYVKLLSVAGDTATTTQQVPEPASLLLSGAALATLAWSRRKLWAKH